MQVVLQLVPLELIELVSIFRVINVNAQYDYTYFVSWIRLKLGFSKNEGKRKEGREQRLGDKTRLGLAGVDVIRAVTALRKQAKS